MDRPAASVTHVVAAALIDARGRVLLTQRPPGKHLAGFWEFPGGKVERGESPVDALRRELTEEIGVHIGDAEPLIRIPWNYAEKSILLDVYRVSEYRGDAHAREGQFLQWLELAALNPESMPPADHPAITALRLPRQYLITPEPLSDTAAFCVGLDAALRRGVRLVQLRAKQMPEAALRGLAIRALTLVRSAGAQLLINGRVDLALELDLDGVHLTATQVHNLSKRPLPADKWVAASCHDANEIELAQRLDVDFLCVGAVRATPTHPGVSPLGWEGLTQLCARSVLPVFALGDMTQADEGLARTCGAQGIAAIRGLWSA